MSGKPVPSEERNQAVYDLAVLAHWDRDSLARLFGITVERVAQIVSREAGERRRLGGER